MERTRRTKALGTEVAFLRNLRYALSVLLSMDCSQFASKSSIPQGPCTGFTFTVTVPFQHLLGIPFSHDPPVGSCMPGAVLCRLVFLPVVALAKRLWAPSTTTGDRFVLLHFSICRRMPESETPCRETQTSQAVFPHHAPETAILACTPRLRTRLFQQVLLQPWVHTDTVSVSGFLPRTAEHVWHIKNTCRLLHTI